MEIIVKDSPEEMSQAAARVVARTLNAKPNAVLGLATGHTMIPVYGELVRLYERGRISLKKAVTFNLDEYAGLGRGEHHFGLAPRIGLEVVGYPH